MPFINAAVADAQEDKPLPEGEYDLTIKNAEVKTSKKGKNMVQVLLICDDPDFKNSQPISHFIMLPEKDDEYRDLHLRNMKRFLTLFNVPFEDNGFDTDDLVGQSAKCHVTLQARKGPDGIETGEEMASIRLPRVKEEEAEDKKPVRRAGGRRR